VVEADLLLLVLEKNQDLALQNLTIRMMISEAVVITVVGKTWIPQTNK
jgi:hypothetical protein